MRQNHPSIYSEKPLSMGSFLMERMFWLKIVMAHTEWLTETFSTTCAVWYRGLWGLVVVRLSQISGRVLTRCLGLDSWRLPAIHFICVILFRMLKDYFHGVLSSTGLTPTLSSRLLTLASLKVPTQKATLGRRRIKVSSYRWNGFPQKLWLKAFSQRSPMWWVHYIVPSLLTLFPTHSMNCVSSSIFLLSSSPPPSASPSPALGQSV